MINCVALSTLTKVDLIYTIRVPFLHEDLLKYHLYFSLVYHYAKDYR